MSSKQSSGRGSGRTARGPSFSQDVVITKTAALPVRSSGRPDHSSSFRIRTTCCFCRHGISPGIGCFPAPATNAASMAVTAAPVQSLRVHTGAECVPPLLGQRQICCCYFPLYCSSVTFSIHSTTLPGSFSSQMEMCVMELSGAAPCQCFTPAGQITTSPGRSSRMGLPHS